MSNHNREEVEEEPSLELINYENEEENDNLGDMEILARLECIKAKLTNPEMFVSGYDVDDQGIEQASDPDSPGERLLTASEEGNLDLASELITNDPQLVNYQDEDGYTALHRAAYSDNPQIIRLLLTKGAKINAITQDGWTPLHSSCHWNSFKSVRELVDHNADINTKTNGGHTPLHVASNQQSRECMIILLTSPGIDVNIKNELGETSKDLANRAGRHGHLFDMSRDSINKL